MKPGTRVSFLTTNGQLATGVIIMTMGSKAAIRIESLDGATCRRHVVRPVVGLYLAGVVTC